MEKVLKIYENRKVFYGISIVLIMIGMISWAVKGLNYGTEFRGGTLIDIKINADYNIEDIREIANKYDDKADARAVEGKEVNITSSTLKPTEINRLVADIKAKYPKAELMESNNIGPSVGKELRQKALISSIAAVIGILIYITLRFELKSGLAAIVALAHDVLITVGVYAVFQVPVNSSFIAAILTILGYSINDTIVVFDRIRENKSYGRYKNNPGMLIDASITQTMARSINTMMTTLFTITAVYVLGVPSVKEFAFPLIIGIISGGYSSIFIASPLWVTCEGKKKFA